MNNLFKELKDHRMKVTKGGSEKMGGGERKKKKRERQWSCGLHGLLSQHCRADRTPAVHADIYYCHARVHPVCPRRPLAHRLNPPPPPHPFARASEHH